MHEKKVKLSDTISCRQSRETEFNLLLIKTHLKNNEV